MASVADTQVKPNVQAIVDRCRNEEGSLIMALHALQHECGYVPRDAAMELARGLGVNLARIYEVITFYHLFKLQPPARHTITVCNGTACYLKGAANLLAEVRAQLGVGEGQTTADREFRFDVVRCIGCCGMSPTIVCDGRTHGRVKPADVARLLAEMRNTAPVAREEVPA